jgi:6-phosphogluconolactonase (cycloisomerase 2 family)
MRLTSFQARLAYGAVALLLASPASVLGASLPAGAAPDAHSAGHVYVLNNNLSGPNSITVFNRRSDGALTMAGTTGIGGVGSLAAFSNGTQGSLIRAGGAAGDDDQPSATDATGAPAAVDDPARRGGRLFAADAGSDQISVVDVHDGRLTLAGIFPSGGSGPVSLTYGGGLLYVLNAANANPAAAANVTGFRVGADGALHPIAGSTRPLSAAHPNPAQVLLDPYGHYLLVTEKDTNLIDLYHVAHDGSLSAPTTIPSVGAIPFGMAFDRPERPSEFIVADAAGGANGTGAATAYRLQNGAIHALGPAVPDHQIAPCWMVITPNGRYAYTSNADSQTISGYRIGKDGTITLLNADGATGTTPAGTFPLEEALSGPHYLYVLDSRLLLPVPGPATISGWRIGADGSLSSVVDPAQIVLPFTAIGLAAD